VLSACQGCALLQSRQAFHCPRSSSLILFPIRPSRLLPTLSDSPSPHFSASLSLSLSPPLKSQLPTRPACLPLVLLLLPHPVSFLPCSNSVILRLPPCCVRPVSVPFIRLSVCLSVCPSAFFRCRIASRPPTCISFVTDLARYAKQALHPIQHSYSPS